MASCDLLDHQIWSRPALAETRKSLRDSGTATPDFEYKVEPVGAGAGGGAETRLQEVIDRHAEEGWTLKQVVPTANAGQGLLVIFERAVLVIQILVQPLVPERMGLADAFAEDLAEEGYKVSVEEEGAGLLVSGGADLLRYDLHVHVVDSVVLDRAVNKLLDRLQLTETAKRKARRLLERFRGGESVEEEASATGQRSAAFFIHERFVLSVPLDGGSKGPTAASE
jgi:hypothetical protein